MGDGIGRPPLLLYEVNHLANPDVINVSLCEMPPGMDGLCLPLLLYGQSLILFNIESVILKLHLKNSVFLLSLN